MSDEICKNWYEKGNSAFQQENYELAVQCYDEALRIKPDFAEAKRNRNLALEHIKKKSESSELKEIMGFKEWYDKGNDLVAKNLFREAIKCYDQAIKLNPDFLDAKIKREEALKKFFLNGV